MAYGPELDLINFKETYKLVMAGKGGQRNTMLT